MFGLSTWELLIIVAVALIFVGPDQLPKVARTIGKGMRQVRGAMGKVDDEMRKAVREVSAELDDEGHPLREAPYRSPMAPPDPHTSLEPLQPMAEPHAPPPQSAEGEGMSASAQATADDVHAVQDPVNPKPAAPPVEVQTSRRGANRTMAERDWSEVGKQPVPGRVAQVSPTASPTPSPAVEPAPTAAPADTPPSASATAAAPAPASEKPSA